MPRLLSISTSKSQQRKLSSNSPLLKRTILIQRRQHQPRYSIVWHRTMWGGEWQRVNTKKFHCLSISSEYDGFNGGDLHWTAWVGTKHEQKTHCTNSTHAPFRHDRRTSTPQMFVPWWWWIGDNVLWCDGWRESAQATVSQENSNVANRIWSTVTMLMAGHRVAPSKRESGFPPRIHQTSFRSKNVLRDLRVAELDTFPSPVYLAQSRGLYSARYVFARLTFLMRGKSLRNMDWVTFYCIMSPTLIRGAICITFPTFCKTWIDLHHVT